MTAPQGLDFGLIYSVGNGSVIALCNWFPLHQKKEVSEGNQTRQGLQANAGVDGIAQQQEHSQDFTRLGQVICWLSSKNDTRESRSCSKKAASGLLKAKWLKGTTMIFPKGKNMIDFLQLSKGGRRRTKDSKKAIKVFGKAAYCSQFKCSLCLYLYGMSQTPLNLQRRTRKWCVCLNWKRRLTQ